MKLRSYQMDKFFPGIKFLKEDAREGRCCCYGVLFLNTSYLHAHMRCFYYHCHSERAKAILKAVSDLNC